MAMDCSDPTLGSWLEARQIITDFLIEKFPNAGGYTGQQIQNKAFADAILARLANNQPPILVGYQDEFK